MSFFRNFFNQVSTHLNDRFNVTLPWNPPPSPCGQTCRSEGNEESSICFNAELVGDWHAHEIHQLQALCSGKPCSWIIPLAGNGFLSDTTTGNPIPNATNCITEAGLLHWTNSAIKVSTFFHCVQTGSFHVALRLRVPVRHSSTIQIVFTSCDKQRGCEAPQTNEILIGSDNNIYQIVSCGTFHAEREGYIRIDLIGKKKSGSVFVDVSHVVLIPADGGARHKRSVVPSTTMPEKSHLKFVSNPDDFYFGRRGPSVHLNYTIPATDNNGGCPGQIEYFYNEILVPSNQDVIGSYFCAIGFSGGYLGIQVNSHSERRILFSIWSAYNSDNPEEIPRDFKVTLVRKGKDVYSGEFGNEGSGAQSYMKYLWKSETVLRFLVQAKPLDEENTLFSAWFCDSSKSEGWKLIASFRKPKASTYLQGLYSFSENFIPEMGHVERCCTFGNQWAWDRASGRWMEVTRVKFTADDTARKENRTDVAGGVVNVNNANGGQFYLRNCGFFSDRVEPGQEFCRKERGLSPNINFTELP